MTHIVRDASSGHWRTLLTLATSAWLAAPTHAAAPAEPTPTPPTTLAQPAEPAVSAPADALPPTSTDLALESTRRTVRSTVEWLASGVDSWFGDKPFSEGGKVSNGELGLSVSKREDQSASYGVRFRARFRLPNLESYQYVFVGNDDRREVVTDQPDTFSRQQQLLRTQDRDNTFFAGIGAILRDSIDLRLGFRGGLKPYAQARYRHPWELSPTDRIEFRETLFFTFADRLGSTTALSYEHTLSPTLVARWLNAATATQDSKDLTWSSSLGTYKSYGDQRILALEALFSGVVGAPVSVSDYGLQTRWSQPIHKDFVIGEITVGHFWPRADATQPRTRAWAIGSAIRLKF